MSTTPGYVSNSELANRLSELVDRWNRRENQMIALLAQEEGTVVVTDGLGVNHTLPSFPQLQKDVTAMTDDLTGAVSQVRDMTSAVTALAAGAADSASAASDAADRAEAAATAVEDSIANADAASTQAAEKAAEAAASAASAAHEAGVAASAADAASDSAGTAAAAAAAASTSASQASASAAAADASRAAAAGLLDDMTDLADLVEADAQAAASSKDAAAASAVDAASSAATAADRANAAAASAATATTKAAEAADSATTAASHASSASGSAAAAASSSSSAASAKVAAEDARDKARLYANAPQGTEVAPGEFSAKHWALQAQAATTGSLVYMGTWNPSDGSYPAAPVKGHFYKVVGNGTVGGTAYNAGDQIVYDGADWDKIDNTDQVTSVAGKVGAVSLVAGDIGGLGALATRNDVDWTAHVTGKPATFPPSAHSHTKAEVGLGNVDNTSDLDKPISTAVQAALDGKANTSHTHAISEVSGLQSALDAKASLSGPTFTGAVTVTSQAGFELRRALGRIFIREEGGSLSIAATTADNTAYAPLNLKGTTLTFNGAQVWHSASFDPSSKSDVGHTHAVADVSGLQSELDGKAAASHTHTTADVDGLQAALDGKASLNANVSFGNISSLNGLLYNEGDNWNVRAGNSGSGYAYFGFKPDGSFVAANGDVYARAFRNNSGAPGAKYFVGDDVTLNDVNIANTLGVVGAQNPSAGHISYGNSGACSAGFDGTSFRLWVRNASGSHVNHFEFDRDGTLRIHDGSLFANGNVIAYASDGRLKENIVDASAAKVSDFFDRFRVREFDWDYEAIAKLNPSFKPSADHEIGAIAQEVEEIYPLMVANHEHSGIRTIMWEKAVPLLIAEVQALRKRVAALEGRA